MQAGERMASGRDVRDAARRAVAGANVRCAAFTMRVARRRFSRASAQSGSALRCPTFDAVVRHVDEYTRHEQADEPARADQQTLARPE